MEESMDQLLLGEIFFFTSLLFLGGIFNTIQCFIKKGSGRLINVLQILVFGGMITLYPFSEYSNFRREFKFASIFVFGFMLVIELLESSHAWHERKYYLSSKYSHEDESGSETKAKGLWARLTEKKVVNTEEHRFGDKVLQGHNDKLFWSLFNLFFIALLTFFSVIIYIGGM